MNRPTYEHEQALTYFRAMFQDSSTAGRYLAVFGLATLLYVTLKAVLCIWSNLKAYLLSRYCGLEIDFKTYGSWAVVTGAARGIGRAFAFELARKGLNIVLISKSEQLGNVAQQIANEHGVKTKHIIVNFTGGVEIYDKIEPEVMELDIAVLVNNVGMSRGNWLRFADRGAETDSEDNQIYRDMISVNCKAVTFMSKMVIPKMAEKRKGIIINISSEFGAFPAPLSTVYSATKAYVDFFSRALQAEYQSKGIVIQSLLTGFVPTSMTQMNERSLFGPDATTYVQSALATLGHQSRSCGYWPHALHMNYYLSLPDQILHKTMMSKGASFDERKAANQRRQQQTQHKAD